MLDVEQSVTPYVCWPERRNEVCRQAQTPCGTNDRTGRNFARPCQSPNRGQMLGEMLSSPEPTTLRRFHFRTICVGEEQLPELQFVAGPM